MVKRLLPLLPVLALGCASAPPRIGPVTPVEVKEPIYYPVYCDSGALIAPALPIGELSAGSAAAATMKAYAASIVLLKGAVRKRDAIIQACARPLDGADATGAARSEYSVTASKSSKQSQK